MKNDFLDDQNRGSRIFLVHFQQQKRIGLRIASELGRRATDEMGTEEETTMGRLTGLALAVVLVVSFGQSAKAQSADPGAVMGFGYAGFGLDYTQAIPSNSLVLDRWWMLEATSMVGPMLPDPATAQAAVVGAPATPAPRVARPARSLARGGSRRMGRSATPASSPLPTGSLDWAGSVVVPLYSPIQRYATYGQGYEVSPYGTADYGAAYKGLYSGN
jgi:hypothetical protein